MCAFLAVLLSNKNIFFLTSDQIPSVHPTLNELDVEKQNVLKASYRKLPNVYCQFKRLITHHHKLLHNCTVKWQFYEEVPYCGPPRKIKREKEVFQFKVLNPSIIMSGGFLPLTAVHLK